jgi:hypothetical protein
MRVLFLKGIRRISLKLVWIGIVGLIVCNVAADSAFISVPLQRTGVDNDARGLVTINLGPTNSSLLLQLTNLAPNRTYGVMSGGVLRGTLIPDRNGRALLRFSHPFSQGTPQFNFDPRGRLLEIVQSGTAVLRARISGVNEPRGTIINEQVALARVPGASGGANTTYELLTNGTRRFSVTLTNVRDGGWRVYVDGIRRGNILVSGGTGVITFDNSAATPGPALNFDPRGLVVDITRTNILRFSSRFLARARGISAATPSVQDFLIPPVTPLTGFARGRLSVDRDARRKFDLELIDVPVGNYELLINSVFKGFITVVADPAGTQGEIQFASEPDDEEELPLNFSVLTSFYTISRPGVVLFQGQPIPTSLVETVIPPVRLGLPLLNLGRDRDGIARTRFKRDERGSRHFDVLLRNVPTGVYFLTVDEIPVATIFVPDTGTGTIGLVEFEDEPEAGELPMTFDPFGKTLAIERDGVRFFERAFPENP